MAPSEAPPGQNPTTGKFALRGIITALLTPFTRESQVDEDSLREIVGFQLKHRVNGLFPCGTTGLGPAMQPEQRKRVAEVVVKEVRQRVPVIVQVGASDPLISLELASHAEKIGADAIGSLTPFYYQPGEDAIVQFFKSLSETTSLPLFIYNIPRHTGNNIDAKLLLSLSKIPNLVGIKDSSRDFLQLMDFLGTVPSGFNVIVGTDSFVFPAFCAGANASVSAIANPFPDLMVGIYEAFRSGEFQKAAELQRKVHVLRNLVGNPPIAPLLEALKLRGLRSGSVKPPLRSMTATETEDLRKHISGLFPDLLIASA